MVTDMQIPVLMSSDKLTQPIIAPVQDTLVAKQNYAVGDQFIYNNTLYKTIAVINATAPITIGTNAVAADDITTQMKKGVQLLWSNPNPDASFAAQNIWFDGNNEYYDLLIFIVSYNNGWGGKVYDSVIVSKGISAIYAGEYGGAESGRIFTYTNNHVYTASDGFTNNGAVDNNRAVPYKIYGIKLI